MCRVRGFLGVFEGTFFFIGGVFRIYVVVGAIVILEIISFIV